MFELPGVETVEEVSIDGEVVKGLKPPVQLLRADKAA
jgi:ATP-dependent protease Clp ATPase subunit